MKLSCVHRLTPEQLEPIKELYRKRCESRREMTFSGMPGLVELIREFSSPLLRYPREYREAMRELGLQEWPELKAKLSTPDAFNTLTILQSYLVAYQADQQAKRAYMYGGCSLMWAKAYKKRLLRYKELKSLL